MRRQGRLLRTQRERGHPARRPRRDGQDKKGCHYMNTPNGFVEKAPKRRGLPRGKKRSGNAAAKAGTLRAFLMHVTRGILPTTAAAIFLAERAGRLSETCLPRRGLQDRTGSRPAFPRKHRPLFPFMPSAVGISAPLPNSVFHSESTALAHRGLDAGGAPFSQTLRVAAPV